MSIKQDRAGTRTAEDLRRRLNVKAIDESVEKVEENQQTVDNLGRSVEALNKSLTNTREDYVSTLNQTFTEAQKRQARTNIGAGNSSFSGSYDDLTNKPDIPTRISDLTNDSDFVEDSNYVHTDNNYTTSEKNKLAGLNNITVDSAMSSTSTNPVQNKVVKAYIDANASSGGGSAIYQEYHTDYAGYVWFNDGLLIQWGRTSITPTAINTDTTARITYTYSYDNIPDRKTEVSSATPSVAKVASGGGTTTALSKQGMNIYVNSSTTKAVTVDWLATGYKGT
jgi:hypothetical protein